MCKISQSLQISKIFYQLNFWYYHNLRFYWFFLKILSCSYVRALYVSIHSSLVKLVIDNHVYFTLSLQNNDIMIFSRAYHFECILKLCFGYSSWDCIAMVFPKIKVGPNDIVLKQQKYTYCIINVVHTLYI